MYSFLEDTGIKFQIDIHDAPVWVKVMYLNPETFKTAPIFYFLQMCPENDHVSKTICHRYMMLMNLQKLAQYILLGKGGAKL